MPSSSDTRASSAPVVIAIHDPNDMPPAQIGRSGNRSLDKRECRAKIVFLPRPRIERAGAAADASEVEAQRGDADARHRLRRLIQRLGVHRAAMQRVRVAKHSHRARLALRQVEQRLERAGRARDLTQKV